MRVARSVRIEDGILPRLREHNVNLFTPWGPRYSWESRGGIIRDGDKEVSTLKFLKVIWDQLSGNMPDKSLHWTFLGADLYGTRLNGLPEDVVGEYFASLSGWLSQILPEVEFRLWSKYDSTAQPYRQRVTSSFELHVGPELLRRTSQTAHTMGRDGDPKAYLVERLAEAMLIEDLLHPIKISCVRRHKDDQVDANLPRLYVVPESLTAPWM